MGSAALPLQKLQISTTDACPPVRELESGEAPAVRFFEFVLLIVTLNLLDRGEGAKQPVGFMVRPRREEESVLGPGIAPITKCESPESINGNGLVARVEEFSLVAGRSRD